MSTETTPREARELIHGTFEAVDRAACFPTCGPLCDALTALIEADRAVGRAELTQARADEQGIFDLRAQLTAEREARERAEAENSGLMEAIELERSGRLEASRERNAAEQRLEVARGLLRRWINGTATLAETDAFLASPVGPTAEPAPGLPPGGEAAVEPCRRCGSVLGPMCDCDPRSPQPSGDTKGGTDGK